MLVDLQASNLVEPDAKITQSARKATEGCYCENAHPIRSVNAFPIRRMAQPARRGLWAAFSPSLTAKTL